MKTLLLASAMIIIFPLAADAHKVKRNCLWRGGTVLPIRVMCRDGENASRKVSDRAQSPLAPGHESPGDKPRCEDDKDHDYKK